MEREEEKRERKKQTKQKPREGKEAQQRVPEEETKHTCSLRSRYYRSSRFKVEDTQPD